MSEMLIYQIIFCWMHVIIHCTHYFSSMDGQCTILKWREAAKKKTKKKEKSHPPRTIKVQLWSTNQRIYDHPIYPHQTGLSSSRTSTQRTIQIPNGYNAHRIILSNHNARELTPSPHLQCQLIDAHMHTKTNNIKPTQPRGPPPNIQSNGVHIAQQ